MQKHSNHILFYIFYSFHIHSVMGTRRRAFNKLLLNLTRDWVYVKSWKLNLTDFLVSNKVKTFIAINCNCNELNLVKDNEIKFDQYK